MNSIVVNDSVTASRRLNRMSRSVRKRGLRFAEANLNFPSFAGGSGARYEEAAMRVLVIEDDPKLARFVAKGLREENFVVDVAGSGERGGEMLIEAEYDVIVLDWLLPGKDGVAVCESLRARGMSTPIL